MNLRTVFKYALHAQVVEIELPTDGIVRLVAVDPATQQPTLWVEHDLSGATERRTFLVVGTGMGVEPDTVHIGSVINEPFVWHIYERPQVPA